MNPQIVLTVIWFAMLSSLFFNMGALFLTTQNFLEPIKLENIDYILFSISMVIILSAPSVVKKMIKQKIIYTDLNQEFIKKFIPLMVVRLAMIEGAFLIGFMRAFLARKPLMIIPYLVFALYGLFRAKPTKENIKAWLD